MELFRQYLAQKKAIYKLHATLGKLEYMAQVIERVCDPLLDQRIKYIELMPKGIKLIKAIETVLIKHNLKSSLRFSSMRPTSESTH